MTNPIPTTSHLFLSIEQARADFVEMVLTHGKEFALSLTLEETGYKGEALKFITQ